MPLSESILILLALLSLAMLAVPLARYLPIPFTVVLVGFGIALSWLSQYWPPLEVIHDFRLTPDMVLFVFLPALIFESGYNLDARQLIKDILPVLVLAVPALLLSTLLVGVGLHLAMGMSFGLALLFGALISATDPVAVIALFKELGAPLRLNVLVEGESLFNDATAIVVFHILLGVVVADAVLDGPALAHAGIEFLYVFLGGALLGVVCGLIVCEWMRLLRDNFSAILILSVILAYASFIFAEHFLHISGVMAVVGASLALGVYGITRIPHHAGEGLRENWEVFAYICNALLFLLVGLSVDLKDLVIDLPYIIVAIVLVLVCRLPAVYWLLPSTLRWFHLPAVRRSDQHIMWWGGLKGGLAIAIVLSLPDTLAQKPLLINMTLGVVMFTLLVNAPSIKPLMAKLGLSALDVNDKVEMQQGILHARANAKKVLKSMGKSHFLSDASMHKAEDMVEEILPEQDFAISQDQQLKYVRQIAMRAELEELESLRDAGLVPQYVLMDIKSELQIEKEAEPGEQLPVSPLSRFENWLLGLIREKDELAGWLSRYQSMRMSSQLRRTFIRILMADAAIRHLKTRKDCDDEVRLEMKQELIDQLQEFHAEVGDVYLNFPSFFTQFESHIGMRVALAGASWQVSNDQKHGEIGQKAYHCIQGLLSEAASRIPDMQEVPLNLPPRDLIRMVPMFSALDDELAELLSTKAQVVQFLSGDTVIQEGDKGDALYIISKGLMEVTHWNEQHEDEVLANLRTGDFFGEMALLGDQVRLATVTAKQTSTLLRLKQKDVLALAEENPEIERRLKEAEAERMKTLQPEAQAQ